MRFPFENMMAPWMMSSQLRHVFSSTSTRVRPVTRAGCSGYSCGRLMTIVTGGDSSSTGISATISAAFGETFTDRGRSSVGSCVPIHSETLINESSMIKGDIFASDQYTFKGEEKGKSKRIKERLMVWIALTNFLVHASIGPLNRFLLSIHQALVRFGRYLRERK
jgi:hypothetical protein